MAVLPKEARGCIRNPSFPKVYFFLGDRYWRYDLTRDYGEVRYPLSLGLWRLTGSFAGGIDAAFDEKGSIPQKSHFFKRDKYVRYNWHTEEIDVGPSPISRWNLGPDFEGDIVACCNLVRSQRPKTYFFKQGRYVRYDWALERPDAGYPRPTGAGWPSGLTAWAEHKGALLLTCADARLEAGENRLLAYPQGTKKGQAGWQLGVRFANPANFSDELERAKIPEFYGDDDAGSGTIPPGSIARLGLIAPGRPGTLDTGANRSDLGSRLSAGTVASPPLRTNLERIGRMLEPGAPIVLLGCDCARGSAGDELLEALSGIWPGHPVSGFTRIGRADAGKQRRPGEPCDNPGVRIVGQTWAHESFPRHRKTALDGGIVDAHD